MRKTLTLAAVAALALTAGCSTVCHIDPDAPAMDRCLAAMHAAELAVELCEPLSDDWTEETR